MNGVALIVALVSALCGGAVASLVTGVLARPKTRAEAAKLIQESGDLLDRRWREWGQGLEEEIKQLRTELANVQATLLSEQLVSRLALGWASLLVVQLRGHEIAPVPPPEQIRHLTEEALP